MDEDLAAELRARAAADQEARERLEHFPVRRLGGWMSKKAKRSVETVRAIDEDNTAWLKELVRRQGWPGRSLVGEEAAHAAWLLVQHADHDPAFQRECLDLLEKAVQRRDASASDWAYLTDRVLRAEGRPQRYGTQFMYGPDGLQPQPIENPERLDEHRARVGLGPFEEYRQQMRRVYNTKMPSQPAPGRPVASCRSGSLEVSLRPLKLSGPANAFGALLARLRSRQEPVAADVPLPWLPEGCSPCRIGNGLGATRKGKLILRWHEIAQPASPCVEVFYQERPSHSPRLEPTSLGNRHAVWVFEATGDWLWIVVMTEKGKPYSLLGKLSEEELRRVAATLPE
jgi:hypothetical protein